MKQRIKNGKTLTPNPEQNAARHRLEQLRRRAREIFEARGSVRGCELDAWILADIEFNSGSGLRGGNAVNGKERS